MHALLQPADGPPASAVADVAHTIVDESDRYEAAVSALCAHPSIDTAMVVADDDEGAVRRITAVWAWAAGAAESIDDVLGSLRDRLAYDTLPQSIIIVDSMPHTSAGHIDRAAVRKIVAVARLVGCVRPVRTP